MYQMYLERLVSLVGRDLINYVYEQVSRNTLTHAVFPRFKVSLGTLFLFFKLSRFLKRFFLRITIFISQRFNGVATVVDETTAVKNKFQILTRRFQPSGLFEVIAIQGPLVSNLTFSVDLNRKCVTSALNKCLVSPIRPFSARINKHYN